MKHVRAKALRSLVAKAQAVVEGDVGYVVYKSVVLVRRDRPQHVNEQLHSRQGCLWGSIHSSSCCSLGQFVIWFCLRSVRSIVYSGAGSSNSGLCLVCRDTFDFKPSSVFVQYAYREYRIRLFSSPVVVVFWCKTNCKPIFRGFYLHRLHAGRPVSRPVNVGWLPRMGRVDVKVVIVVLTAHNI